MNSNSDKIFVILTFIRISLIKIRFLSNFSTIILKKYDSSWSKLNFPQFDDNLTIYDKNSWNPGANPGFLNKFEAKKISIVKNHNSVKYLSNNSEKVCFVLIQIKIVQFGDILTKFLKFWCKFWIFWLNLKLKKNLYSQKSKLYQIFVQ